MAKTRIPALPKLLHRKLYKTGQTRGADDDEIYQNRVLRNSTVIIPYPFWEYWRPPTPNFYENGYIVLISPDQFFSSPSFTHELAQKGLNLGYNALVFYETRQQWINFNPDNYGWVHATSRVGNLGGQFVARIPATTSLGEGAKINWGFTETSIKGAGIRVYEYASANTIEITRLQLEALFWSCYDSEQIASDNGMTVEQIQLRKSAVFDECQRLSLNDSNQLYGARIINAQGHAICPLCLESLSAQGFFSRMEQAQGRAVLDLTITQLNLFHIEELRLGEWNHRPYNLGWGHHHCNVVVKDSGINETLQWMSAVLQRNAANGYSIVASNSGI